MRRRVVFVLIFVQFSLLAASAGADGQVVHPAVAPRVFGGEEYSAGSTAGSLIPSQGHAQDSSAPAQAVTIFFRQEHRYTKRASSRYDANLVDRVVLWHKASDDRMPGFVVGGVSFLFFGHDH